MTCMFVYVLIMKTLKNYCSIGEYPLTCIDPPFPKYEIASTGECRGPTSQCKQRGEPIHVSKKSQLWANPEQCQWNICLLDPRQKEKYSVSHSTDYIDRKTSMESSPKILIHMDEVISIEPFLPFSGIRSCRGVTE